MMLSKKELVDNYFKQRRKSTIFTVCAVVFLILFILVSFAFSDVADNYISAVDSIDFTCKMLDYDSGRLNEDTNIAYCLNWKDEFKSVPLSDVVATFMNEYYEREEYDLREYKLSNKCKRNLTISFDTEDQEIRVRCR